MALSAAELSRLVAAAETVCADDRSMPELVFLEGFCVGYWKRDLPGKGVAGQSE